MAAQLPAVTSC